MIQPSLYRYPGVLHIHTHFSYDSPGPFRDVIAAAQYAGLRWIIVTDHNTLEGRSFEGWHGDVLAIVGHEVTPRYNHLLAVNVERPVNPRQSPQHMFDQVYAEGGFGIIAHPDDRTVNRVKRKTYAWQDWSIDGPGNRRGNQPVGLELWNLMSDWASSLTPVTKYINFFFMQRELRGPTSSTLAWWDRLNIAGKPTFGVAGLDVHAMRHRLFGLITIEVFSYRRAFQTLTNYLVLQEPLHANPQRARQQVFDGLIQGRLFFLNRLDGDIAGIPLVATRGDERWSSGDMPSLAGGPITMLADVERQASIRLLHNGRLVCCGTRSLGHTVNEPGVYRLEAYHRSGRPWLFTNPIYVGA